MEKAGSRRRLKNPVGDRAYYHQITRNGGASMDAPCHHLPGCWSAHVTLVNNCAQYQDNGIQELNRPGLALLNDRHQGDTTQR